ncbi:hypothetical protein EIP86_000802 [Pleurotus ostreatoroseus]|nr:hypothetical protein EIP86_000802 [Pleurotus ostreatoroseus]
MGPAQNQDLELCETMRQEEWEVLEAIYPDYVSKDQQGIIRFEVPVELPAPRFVMAVQGVAVQSEEVPHPQNLNEANPEQQPTERMSPLVSLSNLPPLLLEILLPPSYPLYDPPQIVSMHAMQSWLPLARLHRIFIDKWEAGEGVLYTWIECVRSGEFLGLLGLTFSVQGNEYIQIPHPAPRILIPQLAAYDASSEQARFALSSYNCEVCLTSIKGAKCDVGRVGCPDPRCVKEAREANEDEVRRVVTEEEVRRWKWLKQKRLMEKDTTMIHCPIPSCQTPVSKPTNVEEGSGWERLRTCPECSFSFCSYCRRTWHGPLSDCPLSATDSFVSKYMALEDGDPEKRFLEQRYGIANLRRLVAKYKEDEANRQWFAQSTMACPSCHVKVQKSVGCNHMTCAQCGQHFCYRCGSRLDASHPYKHFNTPGTSCFSKLFDVQSVDDDWQPIEGFEFL